MILAYKRGTLTMVELVMKHPLTTRVKDADGKEFGYRATDKHRKLFKGEEAVADAILWIEDCQRGQALVSYLQRTGESTVCKMAKILKISPNVVQRVVNGLLERDEIQPSKYGNYIVR